MRDAVRFLTLRSRIGPRIGSGIGSQIGSRIGSTANVIYLAFIYLGIIQKLPMKIQNHLGDLNNLKGYFQITKIQKCLPYYQ